MIPFTWQSTVIGLVMALHAWSWILGVTGAAARYLGRDGPVLRYAAEAGYPFYVLHLPVLTFLGCWVVDLNWGIAAKFILLNAATVGATAAVYEVFVRRVPIMRFFFGMKAVRRGDPRPRGVAN